MGAALLVGKSKSRFQPTVWRSRRTRASARRSNSEGSRLDITSRRSACPQ